MDSVQLKAIELIKYLPQEKLGKVISYIEFVQAQNDPVLLLDQDDQDEIEEIFKSGEWISNDDLKDKINQLKS